MEISTVVDIVSKYLRPFGSGYVNTLDDLFITEEKP
jgi:hypothetical protein